MEQLIEFAGNHLALVAALAVILFLLAQNILADVGGKGAISPQQATELINRKDAIVLDVRPIGDFSKAHIINAINIPLNSLKNQLNQLEKHKDTPVVVSCRSGAQASGACKILNASGFDEVYNLKGGIMAWESASLPVSRK